MSPLVDLQVLASRKHLATMLKWAREWLLSGVNSNMINKFVFSLEWFPISAALLPEAGVIRALGSANMIHRYVGNNFLHCWKLFQTRRPIF